MTGIKIKYSGIDRLYDDYSWRLTRRAKKVWQSGMVLTGRDNTKSQRYRLEQSLQTYTKRKHALITQNCTDALYFVLKAYGINKGSKVICPAYSFISTATAIKRTGAEIVWVDTDDNGLIGDLTFCQKANAVVYVNLFGNLADYDRLRKYCDSNKIPLIEDAAQSFGAYYKKIPSGRLGDSSVLSFSPTKNLPAFGNGGAVLTDSDIVAGKVKSLRYHGAGELPVPYGYNSIMSEDHCAQVNFLLGKYKKLQKRRHELRNRYDKNLQRYTFYPINTQADTVGSDHKYVIRVDDRDKLKQYLLTMGIETQIHYEIPMPHTSFFSSTYAFPNAEKLSRQCLSLPLYPHLKDWEVDFVCEKLKDFYGV